MRDLVFVVSLSLLCIVLAAQDTTRVSLIFAGDVMGHDSQISSAWDPVKKKYDYTSCFSFIKPYIAFADVAIGNLEVTLAGPPYKGYPQFSSPDQLAHTLKDVGFDALVTANNHCVDRGKKGLVRTLDVLDSLKMPYAGTYKDSAHRASHYPLIINKNGFTLALLNYTYGTNGLPVHKPNIVNMLDTALIRKDIISAKQSNPDAIIVFTHWGNEYERLPSKWQKVVTEFCFRHGAQLVIGAHPHVLQPMEWRKDKDQFVAYSLGNFVSGQRKQYTDGGALAFVQLSKVHFSPDSSVLSIDSAGYFLEWVYRTADAQKDYYIIPASDGNQKNRAFIKDAASRAAYDLFLSDSRDLFKKHNVNVSEITSAPLAGKPVSYRVLLLITRDDQDPWTILTSQRTYTWGVDRNDRDDGSVYWTSGDFHTEEEAIRYLQKYIAQHPDAKVVTVRNGMIE
jgi:poly-gamma-glutamate capsule biosynthesis protein CapA/YwtB (metallophosphatase superfamily)